MELPSKYGKEINNDKCVKSKKSTKFKMITNVFKKSDDEDTLEQPSKQTRKRLKKKHNALNTIGESIGENYTSIGIGSKNPLFKNEESDIYGNIHTAANNITEKRKQKKKKKYTMVEEKVEIDSQISDHKRKAIKQEKDSHKQIKPRIKCIDETRGVEFYVKDKETKKKVQKLLSQKYKPGMLSELLQIRNFGHLIVPWDPSFGLDPSYKLPESNTVEDEPKLTINPLFDLSKRNDAYLSSAGSKYNVVFVGNLPSDIDNFQLKKLFRKCGPIYSIKLRQNKLKKNIRKTQNNKTFSETNNIPAHAVLKFLSVESCKAALKMNGLLYNGHHLRISMAKDEEKPQPERGVFIGNLAFKAQDDDLWQLFGDCGAIENVRIVRTQNGGGKGIGFVNFKAKESVENALKLDGTMLLDRNIRVTRNKNNARSLSDTVTVKKRRKKQKFSQSNKRNELKNSHLE